MAGRPPSPAAAAGGGGGDEDGVGVEGGAVVDMLHTLVPPGPVGVPGGDPGAALALAVHACMLAAGFQVGGGGGGSREKEGVRRLDSGSTFF